MKELQHGSSTRSQSIFLLFSSLFLIIFVVTPFLLYQVNILIKTLGAVLGLFLLLLIVYSLVNLKTVKRYKKALDESRYSIKIHPQSLKG